MATAKGALLQASSRWPSTHLISDVLRVVRFAYPALLLSVFLVGLVVHSVAAVRKTSVSQVSTKAKGPDGKPLPPSAKAVKEAKSKEETPTYSRLQKAFFNWVSVGIVATLVGNAINIVIHALTKRPWWCGQATAVYVISSIFIYGLFLISLVDDPQAPTTFHVITWLVGLFLETLLFAGTLALFKRSRPAQKRWTVGSLILDLFRLVFLLGLIAAYLLFRRSSGGTHSRDTRDAQEPDEHSSLLRENHADQDAPNGHGHGHGHVNGDARGGYGSTDQAPKPEREENEPPAWARPTTMPSRNWWEYLRSYSVFFPYIWPNKSRKLQVMFIVCIVIAVLQRAVNLLLPTQVGIIANVLARKDGVEPYIPWGAIALFGFYKLLQGPSGLLGAVRATLWIPINQYSYRALSSSSFEHVHGLSLDFHLGKKTGEVLSALSKGSSINNFLETVTFTVLPMLVDLALAIGYFLIFYDVYYALVITIVTFCYVYITVRMARWRGEIRRKMVNASRQEDAVKNDSMVSYETVKYFNAEDYEFRRYRDAIDTFQSSEYLVSFSLNILNVTQNGVFLLGLVVTSLLASYQVTTGQRDVGQFVTLLTYMTQLQQPLNLFGSMYRTMQSAMINSERMLELFNEKPSVVDEPNAKTLPSCRGHIEFQDVRFAYDERKPALNGLSFVAPASTTTALVGESGGGKSTVFRLLFRFYNADSGQITVDGHDVHDVTIDSLRRHIGVVPQDTVLFNETLLYNLKYANPDATDEMVFEACRAASIHDRILSFPDGYLTKVGERGLRLSGGEKQRVAIARTILKNPRIILLDEATAALDSETEQHIQVALETLSEGRTMLVIAHRLSTIINADQILCLHEGRVAEAGTHNDLLALNGRYANMWNKQIRAETLMQESVQAGVHAGADTHASDDSVTDDEVSEAAFNPAADIQALMDEGFQFGNAAATDDIDEGISIDDQPVDEALAVNDAGDDQADAGVNVAADGDDEPTATAAEAGENEATGTATTEETTEHDTTHHHNA